MTLPILYINIIFFKSDFFIILRGSEDRALPGWRSARCLRFLFIVCIYAARDGVSPGSARSSGLRRPMTRHRFLPFAFAIAKVLRISKAVSPRHLKVAKAAISISYCYRHTQRVKISVSSVIPSDLLLRLYYAAIRPPLACNIASIAMQYGLNWKRGLKCR